MISKIPKKLGKCPLIDASVEIRFEAFVPNSVVFGMIYSHINKDFPGSIINLPTLNLPDQIRENDPNLKFRPLYRIESENVILQIGPNVISVSSSIPYIGWDILSEKAEKIIKVLIDNRIINKVTRLGQRYINFFDKDVTGSLALHLNQENYISENQLSNIFIRTTLVDDDFINTIQILNNANYNKDDSIKQNGSIIDIDSFREYESDIFTKDYSSELNKSHNSGKRVFFSLLNDDLLKNLEPSGWEEI